MAALKIKSRFRSAVRFVSEQNHIDLFPARHYLRGYTVAAMRTDLSSGLNVALLAFPQGMAYALIAGLPIQYGIISFIAASIIASLFGSSRFNSYGPSNATAVLILSTFLGLQMPEAMAVVALPALVLLTGIFLVIGGYLRVARVVQYVSKTVITGYITGAALLIIANQIKNVLGFEIPQASSFYGVVSGTIGQIPSTHFPSLILALITAAIYFVLTRRFRTLPNVAITLVVMALISSLMSHLGYPVETLSAVTLAGWAPASFPTDFDLWNQLLLPSLALAFLITLESCSIGKSLAARAGDRLNTNQEIFGLGLGNIASAFSGGMAASASLTRSSLNCNSKAASPFSNFYAGLIVLALFIVLGNFIGYIPKPALAVLVISIGLTLINRHNIRVVSRSTRSDAIVFFTTLFVGLVFALDTAIYIGTILSIALFLRKV
ncbi:MAG: SulP family inorganic anion transporter, partial [Puniceicoccaceae bacterium]